MKITTEDFDNAVKKDWDAKTCLLAQTAMRYYPNFRHVGGSYIRTDIEDRISLSSEAIKLRRLFDEHFTFPGDETKPALQQLRASLPIEI